MRDIMLRRVLLVILAQVLNSVISSNLSILKHDNTLYCLLNNDTTSTAITWDYSQKTISYNVFCNIIENTTCVMEDGAFEIKNTINEKLGPILDYRWESIPMQRCVHEINDLTGFELYFSVLKAKPIFLCERKSYGNCYVLLLKGNIEMKRCKESCEKKFREETNKMPWKHFILSKVGHQYTLKQYNGTASTLFTFEDQEYTPKYLIVDGHCKIHSLDVLSSSLPVKLTIKNNFTEHNGVCLGLLVKLSKDYQAIFRLSSGKTMIANNSAKQVDEWQEIVLCIKKSQNTTNNLTLDIILSKSGGIARGVFFIADIFRLCDGPRFVTRQVDKRRSYCCYSLQSSTKFCTNQLQNKNSTGIVNTCSKTTIGVNCIPCQRIFNEKYCESSLICDQIETNGVFCTCAAGYRGMDCDVSCSKGSFGFNCQEQCTNCASSCSSIDGRCRKCKENFIDDYCSTMELPVLKYRPIIKNLHTNSVEISVKTESIGLGDPKFYYIQTKEMSFQDAWKNLTAIRSFSSISENMNLTNLKSNTKYAVRVMLLKGENEGYNGDSIPETHFTTLTKGLGPVNQLRYHIKNETTAVITWKEPTTRVASVKQYIVSYLHNYHLGCQKAGNVSVETYEQVNISQTEVTLHNLQPYSNYIVQVRPYLDGIGKLNEISLNTTSTNFISENEVPSIRYIQNRTQLTVIAEINECENIKGSTFYDIQLQCKSSWCSEEHSFETKINTSHIVDTEFFVLGYTSYIISVRVCRDLCSNETQFKKVEKGFLTEPTAPSVVRNLTAYSVTNDGVRLRWFEPNPPTGILELYLLVRDPDSDNISRNITSPYSHNCTIWKNQICSDIGELSPNRQYTFQIKVKNCNVSEVSNATYVTVTTKNKAPSPPKDLKYFWNEETNCLTLKWEHPDCPNGNILQYKIYIVPDIDNVNEKRNIKIYNVSEEQLLYTTKIEFAELKTNLSSRICILLEAQNHVGYSFVNITLPTPPETPKFVGEPTVTDITSRSFMIKIPEALNMDGEYGEIYVIITDKGSVSYMKSYSLEEEEILSKAKVNKELNSWIFGNFSINNFINGSGSIDVKDDIKLTANTCYQVTILLRNKFDDIKRYKVYTLKLETLPNSNLKLLYLLFLILPIACVILIIFFWVKRQKTGRTSAPILLTTGITPPNSSAGFHSLPNHPIYEEIDDGAENLYEEEICLKTRNRFSKPIKLRNLQAYVKESLDNLELERQYETFEVGQTKPWICGTKPENKSKNRYMGLVAYDHSRVKLDIINNDPHSDYINANYIDGNDTTNAYIATQGPKSTTLNDFWRMIWQEKVECIIMMANTIEDGKKKVEKYWPNINESEKYGDIIVNFTELSVFSQYESKLLKINFQGQERTVQHLHFTCWPNPGTPFYAQDLAPFLKVIMKIHRGNSPIVVHCSAGVGRTGTLILCDICLQMAAKTNEIDVFYQLHKLREQRVNMVDNINQYKLAHLVLIHCLLAPDNGVSCTNEMCKVVNDIILTPKISEQMKYINDTFWQDETMRTTGAKVDGVIVREKNRFQNSLPDDYARVTLMPYPFSDKTSTYINAIKVDGIYSPSKFIVTQYPLSSTFADFWRLIDEYEISTVICLNELDLNDEASCEFYPRTKERMHPTSYLEVTGTDVVIDMYYNIHSIDMKSREKQENRQIKVVHLKQWKYSMPHPGSPAPLLMIYEEMNRLEKKNNRILIACHDAVRASGLFTSMCIIIDRIKMEKVCDVCLAVKAVRHSRLEFVSSLEQFAFLYKCGLEYVQQLEMYSSFCPRK